MKKAIIIIIALLVVAGGVFAGLFFFTDIFDFMKPANENFSIQAKKLFGGKTAKQEVSYQDYLASIEPLKGQNKSYTSNTELSMNVSLPSSVLDYSSQRMINNTNIKLAQSYDVDSKAQAIDMGITYDDSDIINLQAIVDGKKIGIKSDDFYGKTLVFDMDKFVSFCKSNNIEVDENQVKTALNSYEKALNNSSKTNQLIYDLFYLTEDEYNAINKNYGDLLTSLVDQDKYSSKKGQKVSVNGEEVKTTAYTLTLSGKDIYNYIHKLAERAKDDGNIKSIIINKYNLLVKFMKESVDEDELENMTIPDLKTSDIEKAMDSLIKALEQSEESFSSFKYSLRFTIYANKNQDPVRFDIALAKGSDDEGTVFFTEEVGEGKNTYTINVKDLLKKLDSSSSSSKDDDENEDEDEDEDYSSSLSSSSSSSLSSVADALDKIVIVDKYESSDNSKKGTITVSIKASDETQDVLSVEYEKVNSKSEIKNKMKITSPLMSTVSLDIDLEATGLESDKQDMVCNISAKVPVGYSSYEFGLKAKSSIEYGKTDIPSLTDSNSFDVFSKKAEELQPVIDEIFTNASNKLPSKLSKFGVTVTKDQILALKPTVKAPAAPATPAEGTTPDAGTEQPAA
ncbi:MAG: hypothetical protein J6J36_00150 [Clostridia bacterium]|nr:hypothetical protein [Clostridia bacterium]